MQTVPPISVTISTPSPSMSPAAQSIDPQISAAWITSLLAIVVALLSLASNIWTNSRSAQHGRELEEMKSRMDFSDELLRVSMEALSSAAGAIQKIKEFLRLIELSVSGSLDVGPEELTKLRENLVGIYEATQGVLGERERMTFHRAKTLFMEEIEPFLRQIVQSEVTDESKRQLKEYRLELTEIQTGLYNSRTDLVADRLRGKL